MKLPHLSRKQKLIAAGGAGVVVVLLLLRHQASAAAAAQGLTGGAGGGLDVAWHGRPGVDDYASRYDETGRLWEVRHEGDVWVTYLNGVAVGTASKNTPGTVSAETAAHKYTTAQLTSLFVTPNGETIWNPTAAQIAGQNVYNQPLVAMPTFCNSSRAAQVWCQATLDGYCLPLGFAKRSTAKGCVATVAPTLLERVKSVEGQVVTLRGTRYEAR